MADVKSQKITPFLWFDDQAEEAAAFYASVFKNSKVGEIRRYGSDTRDKKADDVMTVSFELEGQPFIGLNAGPHFKFSPAISFFIDCEDQAEVDDLWEKLSAVPEAEQCGWVQDKFGLSWQIIPKQLGELMSDPDPEKSGRVMQAMLKMKKIDVAELERAAKGN